MDVEIGIDEAERQEIDKAALRVGQTGLRGGFEPAESFLAVFRNAKAAAISIGRHLHCLRIACFRRPDQQFRRFHIVLRVNLATPQRMALDAQSGRNALLHQPVQRAHRRVLRVEWRINAVGPGMRHLLQQIERHAFRAGAEILRQAHCVTALVRIAVDRFLEAHQRHIGVWKFQVNRLVQPPQHFGRNFHALSVRHDALRQRHCILVIDGSPGGEKSKCPFTVQPGGNTAEQHLAHHLVKHPAVRWFGRFKHLRQSQLVFGLATGRQQFQILGLQRRRLVHRTRCFRRHPCRVIILVPADAQPPPAHFQPHGIGRQRRPLRNGRRQLGDALPLLGCCIRIIHVDRRQMQGRRRLPVGLLTRHLE